MDKTLEEIVCTPPLDDPLDIARITPLLVKFVRVLFEIVHPVPEKFHEIPVICAAPVVILLNVLLVMFFVGPVPAVSGPSELLQQTTAVAPVSVTFEKLFWLAAEAVLKL